MPNILGVSVVLNTLANASQQEFNLAVVPGTVVMVFVDGLHRTDYTLDGPTMIFNTPLVGGERVVVYSGQGGTFVPQAYVLGLIQNLADKNETNAELESKVNITGDHMNGPLLLHGDPTDPLGAVTKQYADAAFDMEAIQGLLDAALLTRPTKAYVDTQIGTRIGTDSRGEPNGTAILDGNRQLFSWEIPNHLLSGERTFTRIGTLKVGISDWSGVWWPRLNGVIVGLVATLDVPSAGANVVVDIRKNGLAILPDPKLVIDAGFNVKELDLRPNSTISFTRGDRISIEIVQVGTTEPGRNLNVQLEFRYS